MAKRRAGQFIQIVGDLQCPQCHEEDAICLRLYGADGEAAGLIVLDCDDCGATFARVSLQTVFRVEKGRQIK
jgi:hypothetical protein